MASCHEETEAPSRQVGKKKRPDYLLWSGAIGITLLYFGWFLVPDTMATQSWLETLSSSVFELMNIMWWSLLLAVLFVGLLGKIPREFVMSILGKGGGFNGIARATLAGVLLDLCSHGILIIGMRFYERGANLGQVIAFLLASPWNSFSLTLILVALVGLKWTLLFILMSMVIGLLAGLLFDYLVRKGTLPGNPHTIDLPPDFRFWPSAREGMSHTRFDGAFFKEMIVDGVKGSRMVMRWIFLGILMAGSVRSFLSADQFQDWFGPTLAGLGLTMIAATIIEVCSEGSTPIAADLVTRAGAPGNGFAFLMTGVSTDYTEIMSLQNTTGSWKIALFLPLVTVPQVLAVAWIMNVFGT